MREIERRLGSLGALVARRLDGDCGVSDTAEILHLAMRDAAGEGAVIPSLETLGEEIVKVGLVYFSGRATDLLSYAFAGPEVDVSGESEAGEEATPSPSASSSELQ